MNDSLHMQVSNCYDHLSRVKLNAVFLESLLALEHLVEFTTTNEWHYEVETKVVLEEVFHADEEGVIALKHDVLLQYGIVNLVILNQYVLPNRFYGEHVLILF